MNREPAVILSAKYVGEAKPHDGFIDVGCVKVAWAAGPVGVYVRRVSTDLSVIEIAVARHDGLAQGELDEQNAEAERYPFGPKEYWRAEMVGKDRYGPDQHLMTDEEFESDWDEGES